MKGVDMCKHMALVCHVISCNETVEGIVHRTEENKNINKFVIESKNGSLSLVWTKNINVKIIIETSEEILAQLVKFVLI